jgi:hypothetical protein
MKSIIVVFLSIFPLINYLWAQEITTSFNDGNWDNAAHWITTNGATSPPVGAWNGKTIIIDRNFNIPNNFVVDLRSSTTLEKIIIKSTGTLNFHANSKLKLPPQAIIELESGAQIVPQNQSAGTLIEIGGSDVWGRACDGCAATTLTGPGYIDENSPPDSPLPISLIRFVESFNGKRVTLSWSTLSEQNFDYFSIERSRDAKNYVQIGTVKGSGWSQTRNDYSFTDHNPMPGINYYRLKSVDFDGYTEIFPAISVFNDNVQVSVTSPVKDKTMTIHSNFEGKAQLVNLFGTSVMVGDVVVGPNEISLPQSLTKGIYLLAVTNDRQLVKKTKIYVE